MQICSGKISAFHGIKETFTSLQNDIKWSLIAITEIILHYFNISNEIWMKFITPTNQTLSPNLVKLLFVDTPGSIPAHTLFTKQPSSFQNIWMMMPHTHAETVILQTLMTYRDCLHFKVFFLFLSNKI